MSALRKTYLVLAVLGAALPLTYYLRWFGSNGEGPSGLIGAWTANDAATGLALDLSITGIAVAVFIVSEVTVRRDWGLLWCLPAMLLIGVSFAFPLYLFLRSRPA